MMMFLVLWAPNSTNIMSIIGKKIFRRHHRRRCRFFFLLLIRTCFILVVRCNERVGMKHFTCMFVRMSVKAARENMPCKQKHLHIAIVDHRHKNRMEHEAKWTESDWLKPATNSQSNQFVVFLSLSHSTSLRYVSVYAFWYGISLYVAYTQCYNANAYTNTSNMNKMWKFSCIKFTYLSVHCTIYTNTIAGHRRKEEKSHITNCHTFSTENVVMIQHISGIPCL